MEWSINTVTVGENCLEIHVLPPTPLLIFHYLFSTVHSKPCTHNRDAQWRNWPLFWSKPGELARAGLLPCSSGSSACKAEQEDWSAKTTCDSTALRKGGSICLLGYGIRIVWPELSAILIAILSRQHWTASSRNKHFPGSEHKATEETRSIMVAQWGGQADTEAWKWQSMPRGSNPDKVEEACC